MLRNKATLPALQKTYDESYLTCSTAVYYEGQVSPFTNPPPPTPGRALYTLPPRLSHALLVHWISVHDAVSLADRSRSRATRRRRCAAGKQP